MSLPWPNIRHARYSSLLCKDIQPSTLKVLHRCSRLRTLILFSENGSQINQIPYDFFLNLRSLRLLNLSFTSITELPDSIGSLKHLRYLDVSDTYIENLPESITNLYGLHTLKLKNCFKLLHLPKNMKNLTNLQHLELDIKRQINSMPPEFGRLTSLQTLSAFIVGKEQGQCIDELKDMSCLQGSICITSLENVASVKEAISAKLDEKPYLDKLELQWNVFKDGQVEQPVLAGLQPHNGIKELVITGYGGFMFPSWLSNPSFYKA
ncbi:hypothetical protein L6164_029968 [Bauhinia variegata]|uniref:Uncharacterized protein n=1 Tax=Bauhinia variegata TaxID=167791 RepID=A0ACB9LAU8_BAUVA|nr:hypothetical protein L6164_029968 [Bauhinia variegata]